MDLREKPGKVQKFLELMLRFRLITLVVMVVASVTMLAKSWDEMAAFPIAASERFGMWFFGIENLQGLWSSSQHLIVASVASIVMLFVFGGLRAGIASVVAPLLFFVALYVLGGGEDMAIPMYGVLAVISLVLFLFVKMSLACMLFPFALLWIFLGVLLNLLPGTPDVPKDLVWGVSSAFGFAVSMAYALVAGKHLGAGVPQAGALVKSAKQLLVPVLVDALLLDVAVSVDMPGGIYWPLSVAWFVAIAAWFYVFLFPMSSFGPWERLRSGSRRVEMKDKKKKGASKKKK